MAPGFSPPMHVHHREDESFYILEGELTLQCGERRFRAGTGAFVFLPRTSLTRSSSKAIGPRAC